MVVREFPFWLYCFAHFRHYSVIHSPLTSAFTLRVVLMNKMMNYGNPTFSQRKWSDHWANDTSVFLCVAFGECARNIYNGQRVKTNIKEIVLGDQLFILLCCCCLNRIIFPKLSFSYFARDNRKHRKQRILIKPKSKFQGVRSSWWSTPLIVSQLKLSDYTFGNVLMSRVKHECMQLIWNYLPNKSYNSVDGQSLCSRQMCMNSIHFLSLPKSKEPSSSSSSSSSKIDSSLLTF